MTGPTQPRAPENAPPVWAEGYSALLRGFERDENLYLNAADHREDIWDDGWLYADGEIAQGRLPAGILKDNGT